MQIIKWQNLSHIFSRKTSLEFKALDDTTGFIEEGKIYSVIGNTGSGKSTLIQHFNALLKPTLGTIQINCKTRVYNKKLKKEEDQEIDFKLKPQKRRIKHVKLLRKTVGLVFQFPEYQLFKDTVLNDIIFGPMQMGVSKEQSIARAKKYIEIVGLQKEHLDKNPFSLSGGQKRRVAIAGILAMEPNILILDEPTAGLDPQGEIEMMRLFQQIHKSGKTIIIVTHNMDHVLEYTEETFLMNKGKVVAKDTPHNIFSDIELVKRTQMNLPLVYEFLNELKARKIDIKGMNPRNIDELSEQVYAKLKHKNKGG